MYEKNLSEKKIERKTKLLKATYFFWLGKKNLVLLSSFISIHITQNILNIKLTGHKHIIYITCKEFLV